MATAEAQPVSASGELARQAQKLAVVSAAPEQKDPEEDADMDASESDSDPDAEVDEVLFAEEIFDAIKAPPTEEQVKEIKQLIDSMKDQEAAVDGEEADFFPHMELGFDGTNISFSCNLKQVAAPQEEKTEEGAEPKFEGDTFIKYIFIRDRNQNIVACKQFKQADEPVAVFEVGDDWYNITPYSITNNGFMVAGEACELEDDDENLGPIVVNDQGYYEQDEDIAEEVEEFLTSKEPPQLVAFDKFQATRKGDQVMVEMDVPTIMMWARDTEGRLLGCRQFDEPAFTEGDDKPSGGEPAKKKRKSMDGTAIQDVESGKAEFAADADVKKIRVFAYAIQDDELVTVGAEIDI